MAGKTIILLFLAWALAGCSPVPASPGADGIGDTYYPGLGNGGYDALHYTIELSVDPRNNTLDGESTLEAQATQHLSAFNLDFSGLNINWVTVNGRAAEYGREDRELTITPPAPIREGEVFSVTVAYEGSPKAAAGYGTWWSPGWYHTKNNDVVVSSETSGAATWYPVNDHPLDKATYTFRITVPKPYVTAVNGLLQEEMDHGNTVTYLWEATEPMASYVVGLNVAKYVVETSPGPDGVLIRNYLPPDFPGSSRSGIDQVPAMLEFFSERFGPYPFDAYGIVIVEFPENGPAAMETQTLSQHEQDKAMISLSEEVVAHELAHQWFGDSVSLASWQDIWLKEGAATYAGWLWMEHREGTDFINAKVHILYPLYGFTPDPPGNPSPNNLYTNIIYDRGALTFHALRLRVGDDTFFQILRTYTDRYRHGNAGTADFIAVAEEVSGQDLDEFFDGWLYETQIPAIPEAGMD